MACLASITNLEDPWTNEESYHLARSMLSGYVSNFQKTPKQLDLVVRDLLVNYIKPLFLKHQTPLLTPAARKAISPLPRPLAPSDFESANKPWKFNSPHIVTIFQWILSQLSPPLVEAHWPLIIPPLLTIIDDVSVTYKIKGCSLLLLFLKVCPANLLERSGLGEIFHDTLMPYLLYLPSLTPEEESIPLLDATYDALIALTLARWGTLGTTPSKNEALDSVFRYGILKGYAHAGENVRIARILMEKSADLVNAMGIYCVKHLKDLLPLVSGILTAPFATAYPPLLEAVTLTLRAIVSNAWPRIRYHGGEILRGLIIFCDRVDEEDELTDELVGVKGSIEDILHAVVRILRDDEVAEEGLQMLSKHDSRVDALLRV